MTPAANQEGHLLLLGFKDVSLSVSTIEKEVNYIMRRNLSRIFAVVMGLSLFLAILTACGAGTTTGSGTPTAGSTTIKIATDLPVSGKDTSSGKPAEDGANLAVMEANAKHTINGYTLVFDPKDDVGANGLHDPAVGAQNVTALVGDALVAGIVGPFNSSVAKAEMPITNQAPIAQISPANTNQCLTKDTAASGCSGSADLLPTLRPSGKVSYFRIATTDDHQGPVGADYLYKTLGYKKAYVIDDAETYGIGIASFASTIGTSSGGSVYGTVAVVDTTVIPSAAAFRTKFTSTFTDPLNVYSAAAYDCANILIQAIKTALANGAHTPASSGDLAGAKAFRQAVINAVQGTSWDGITGHQAFDSNGDTTNKVISIYQLAAVNGKPDWKYLTAAMPS